jgi:secreted trypsin-like serine protease
MSDRMGVRRGGLLLVLVGTLLLPACGTSPERNSAMQEEGKNLAGSWPRILDGVPVQAGFAPWQVALVLTNESTTDGFFCGGALIASRWVLTAAHCLVGKERVKDPRTDVQVFAGSHNLDCGTPDCAGRRITIEAVVIHKHYRSYSDRPYVNDIALIKLAEEAPKMDYLTMLDHAGEADLAAPKFLAIVIGWGRTSQYGAISTVLQMAPVPIVEPGICQDSYAGAVTEDMICAGGEGKDSCKGDSGGPLVVPDNSGGVALAGVVSWGPACGRPKKYGVYTRVPQFLSWIANTMAE